MRLLTTRTPLSLRPALWAGLWAGLVSALVKLGWEQLLPPRTPGRTEPPLLLLDKLGLHADAATFTFSGTSVNWASLAVHVTFSVVTVLVYCVAVEVLPITSYAAGAAYGIGAFAAFHVVVLPALGLTPAPWDLPLDEWVSELLGHAVWLVSAELVRRGVPGTVSGWRGLGLRRPAQAAVCVSGTKSTFSRTPQSGQHQSAGMSRQAVPAAKPSRSSPASTS